MRHYHITRVFYITLVAVFITTGLVTAIYSQAPVARALPLFEPFGGTIAAIPLVNYLPTVPPVPDPACPIYYTIDNADPTDGLPPVYGVFPIPVLPALSYDNNNLEIPGTPVIGGLEPLPCLGGTALIPLYPLFYDGLFYLDGTGPIPGLDSVPRSIDGF